MERGAGVISPRTMVATVAWPAVMIGASTLVGWAVHFVWLTDWFGNGISMMPNTALAAILAGAAMIALAWNQRALAIAAAAGTAFLGTATLSQHLFQINLGIDTLLLHRDWGQAATTSPGRMGPPAALSYSLIGLAMLLAAILPPGRRARGGSVAIGLFVGVLALLSLVGSLFEADKLHTLPRLTAIATQTSVVLLLLAIGAIASVPDRQPVLLLGGTSGASMLLRRAVPLIVFVPIVLGLLRIHGQNLGYYDAAFGSALRTVVEILLLGLAMWWIAHVVDRHARRIAEQHDEIHRQSGFIAAIVDSSDDAIVGKNLDGIVHSWNRGAERIFGYSAAEAIGQHITFVIPPERFSEEAEVIARLRRGERVEPFDTERLTRAGVRIPLSLSISPIRDSRGRVIGAAKVARDITRRKLLEESLRQNHLLFSALVDQAPQGVYVVDAAFRLQQINAAAASAFVNVPNPIGRDFAEVMHILWGPEVGQQCVAIFRRTLDTGEPYISPLFSHQRHDLGAEESYEWQTQRITLPDGRHGVVCYFQNVTEAVRAAAALRDSKERARLAMQASGVGIWEWNLTTGQIIWDEQMFRIYGMEPSPGGLVSYQDWAHTVLPEDLAEQERILAETRRTGIGRTREFRIRRPGETEPTIIHGMDAVRTNARGDVEWIIGTNLDVTQQRRTQEELAAQKRLLEQRVLERTADLERSQANLRRSERIATMGTLAAGMGHDLTNIMVPIRWRLNALDKQEMSPTVREDLADIADSIGYLERLAAGLRQMAANPDAAPPPGGTDLSEWWVEACGLYRSILARQIRLVSEIPEPSASPTLPRVYINRIGLTQAVFNLVQNANEVLVARGSGTITISARLNPDDGGASVLVGVSDDGPGMTPEVAARCFEPYFSTKGRTITTGMGLSLVRGILENVGGNVILHTTPGRGATFLLRIPVTLPAPDSGRPAGQPSPEASAGPSIHVPLNPLQREQRSGEASA